MASIKTICIYWIVFGLHVVVFSGSIIIEDATPTNRVDTTECYVINAEGRAVYTGTRNATKTGKPCLNWDLVLDTSELVGEENVTAAKNYCRDFVFIGEPYCGITLHRVNATQCPKFSTINMCGIPRCTNI